MHFFNEDIKRKFKTYARWNVTYVVMTYELRNVFRKCDIELVFLTCAFNHGRSTAIYRTTLSTFETNMIHGLGKVLTFITFKNR